MVAWLSGKKTYITAAAGAVYGLLVAFKIVANEPAIGRLSQAETSQHGVRPWARL